MQFLLALLLTTLPAAVSAQDVVAAGFKSANTAYPSGSTIQNMTDGSLISSDGSIVRRWGADGTFVADLGAFASPGAPGLLAIAPGQNFLLAGNSTGEVIGVDVTGLGQIPIATVPGNTDAVFVSSTIAYVSAEPCPSACGNSLIKLDVTSGSMTTLVALDGDSGPVALDSAQDLYYGTVDPSLAAGSSSLLRFLKSDLDSPPLPAFQANNDLVVIEVESHPPDGAWTPATAYPGFTGDSYYRWDGPDLYGSPGVGVLTYEFEVTEAGNYEFDFHNRHEDPQPDQDNDAYVKVDSGPWLKVFSNEGASTVATWNWHSIVDEGGGVQYQANYDLSVGRHTLYISGRSNGFKLDRMVFFLDWSSSPMSLSQPESTLAPLGANQAWTVAGGFDGADDLAHDPKLDQLFLAANNSALGTNKLFTVSTGGVAGIFVDGQPGNAIENLDFTAQENPGVFFPFQPSENGALAYTRSGPGPVLERRILTTDRPQLAFSGVGATTGIGPTSLDLEGAFPGGFAVFFIAPASLVSPLESPVFIGGLPLIHTGMLQGAVVLPPGPLPLDGAGDFGLTFANPLGSIDVFGVQAILFDQLGILVGSSTTDLL